MFIRSVQLLVLAGVAAMVLQAGPSSLRAQSDASTALAGQITSAEEGSMEGVLVTAKKAGSTVAVTVASDERGRYRFPRTRLEPGRYAIRIRAIGYEVDDPGPVEIVEIPAPKAQQLDLKLHKIQDVTTQLTDGEWITSWPGTAAQKRTPFGCAGFCHSLEPIVRSHHTAEQWPAILLRMSRYAATSSPERPQMKPRGGGAGMGGAPVQDENGPISEPTRRDAQYLSSINLSSVTRWQYPLKTLPRPKGKATHAIVTEYDLPRADAMPHDVTVDTDRTLWFTDFGQHYLGHLDPKTGKVVEYPLPISIQGNPTGSLDIRIDRDGYIWMGQMYQSGVARFDKKMHEFKVFPVPSDQIGPVGYAQQAMVAVNSYKVDGKVWMNDPPLVGVRRIDLKTGQYERFEPYKKFSNEPHSMYGIAADSRNNLYLMDLGNTYITRIDAKTTEVTLYPTPTPDSGPRRGTFDAQDRLWFAENRANQVGMFDARSHEFKEWPAPPATYPYDAVLDKNGDIWTGGMFNDRVARINSRTGETVGYLLPRSTNIRRVDVDNSTNPPTLWIGNNHSASIVKVEPLD